MISADITNKEIIAGINTEKGLLSINLQKDFYLDELCLSILTEQELLVSTSEVCNSYVEGSKVYYCFPDLMACIDIQDTNNGCFIFDCFVTNTSNKDQHIRTITPIAYQGDWVAEGYFSMSKATKVLTWPAERCYGDDEAKDVYNSATIVSFWQTAFKDPMNNRNFLAGMCDVPQGMVRYKVIPLVPGKYGNRTMQWACEVDCHSGVRGVRLKPGSTIHTGAHYIRMWQGDFQKGLEEYGDLLQARFKVKSRNRVPVGWCSWYAGYGLNITEDDMINNLKTAKSIPGLEYFQLDDGWTTGMGTRTLGKPIVDEQKFPHGLKWLAESIRSEDLKPGIWVRPFLGWGENKDNPVWAKGACIDISHPEARAWIKQLLHTVTKEWGYEYVKFDFVTFEFYQLWGMAMHYTSTTPVKPYDDTLTNINMYRLALEAIREGVGEDCFLLGCNCLVGPAMGLIDGNRVGDDVDALNWDRTYTMGAKCVSPLYYINGRVWANDPDCIMVHEPFSIEHAKMWGTLATFSGQMGIVSTKLHELPEERLKLLRKLFPIIDIKARPLDITKPNPQEIWWGRVNCDWEEYTVIALFNLSENKKTMKLKISDYGLTENEYIAFEFWKQEQYEGIKDSFEITLNKEECKVLALRKRLNRPQILGSDSHILQGKVEIAGVEWLSEKLELKITKSNTECFNLSVYVPEGYKVKSDLNRIIQDNNIIKILFNKEDLNTSILFEKKMLGAL